MNKLPDQVTAVLLPDGWHTVHWTDGKTTFHCDTTERFDPELDLVGGFSFQDADYGGALTTGPFSSVLALRYATLNPADEQLQRLGAYIDAAGPDGTTRRSICRDLFHNHTGRNRLNELISHLVMTGDYETVEEPTGGRPRTIVRRTGTSS